MYDGLLQTVLVETSNSDGLVWGDELRGRGYPTANWPVPPAAAVTRTVSPLRMRPACSSPVSQHFKNISHEGAVHICLIHGFPEISHCLQ